MTESVCEDENIFKLDHGLYRCMSELYYAIIRPWSWKVHDLLTHEKTILGRLRVSGRGYKRPKTEDDHGSNPKLWLVANESFEICKTL